MKQISLDALNAQLFETIELLKNNNDPQASQNEKIDIENAKAIADLGKVIVDGYKVKAQVMNMMTRTQSFEPSELKGLAIESGIANKD